MANIHNLIQCANVMDVRMRLLAQKTEVLAERLRILRRAFTSETPGGLTLNLIIGADNSLLGQIFYSFIVFYS